ncbi:hypothetical protein [Microcoleus sp. B7-D4]|uniref:hypothetical protein n=1 Tax=Microcoleus sp. B7-D4 TaxID=2818696 RepID=UPI002FD5497B
MRQEAGGRRQKERGRRKEAEGKRQKERRRGASHLCGQARNWSFEAGGRRQEAEGKRKKEGATRRKEPEEVFLQI